RIEAFPFTTPSAPTLRHELGSMPIPSCWRLAVKLFGSSTWNMLESVKSRVDVWTTVFATEASPTGGAMAILKSERVPPATTTWVTPPPPVAAGSAVDDGGGSEAGGCCATAGTASARTSAAAVIRTRG